MSKSTCTKEADTKAGEHFEFGYQRQRYVLKVTVTGVVKEVTKYKENQPCCLGVELRSPPKRLLYPVFELFDIIYLPNFAIVLHLYVEHPNDIR